MFPWRVKAIPRLRYSPPSVGLPGFRVSACWKRAMAPEGSCASSFWLPSFSSLRASASSYGRGREDRNGTAVERDETVVGRAGGAATAAVFTVGALQVSASERASALSGLAASA